MHRFVLKTALFLVPLLVLGAAYEALLRNIPNNYSLKREYLDAHAEEVQVLVLGGSHSYFGVDPAYLSKKGFNAAYVSQSLDYDLAILRKYENRWRSLETVVLEIYQFSFFSTLKTSAESWRAKNYTIYFGLDGDVPLTDHFEILSGFQTMNAKRAFQHYLRGRSSVTCSELGWGTSYKSSHALNLYKSARQAARRHNVSDDRHYDENVATLEALVELCRRLGVRVFLFTAPAHDAYRRALNPEQLAKTIATAEAIAGEYENCEYVNWIASGLFENGDFYDADHVNEIGAEKLTRMIDERVR